MAQLLPIGCQFVIFRGVRHVSLSCSNCWRHGSPHHISVGLPFFLSTAVGVLIQNWWRGQGLDLHFSSESPSSETLIDNCVVNIKTLIYIMHYSSAAKYASRLARNVGGGGRTLSMSSRAKCSLHIQDLKIHINCCLIVKPITDTEAWCAFAQIQFTMNLWVRNFKAIGTYYAVMWLCAMCPSSACLFNQGFWLRTTSSVWKMVHGQIWFVPSLQLTYQLLT